MSTRSMSGSATIARQSPVAWAKPKARAAARAASSLTSANVWNSSRKGRSNTFPALAKPKTWALPMKPEPMRPMRRTGFSDMERLAVDDEGGVEVSGKEIEDVPHRLQPHAPRAFLGEAGHMRGEDHLVEPHERMV